MKKLISYTRLIAKIFFEFIPIIAFLVSFEIWHNFYKSTALLVVLTIIFTVYVVLKDKRIPYLALFICLETTLFGWLTIRFHNPNFLQIRDTLYDLAVAGIIMISAYFKKPAIKKMFSHIFTLDNQTWIKLSYNWGVIFLIFGILNEIVRRNLHTGAWVDYKAFIAVFTVAYGLYLYYKFRDKAVFKV